MTEVREPSNIIEMAEMVRECLLYVSTEAVNPYFDTVCDWALKMLPAADFYELEDKISDVVDEVFRTTVGGKTADQIRLDSDCRLPSKVCGFWSPGTKIIYEKSKPAAPSMFLATENSDGITTVVMVSYQYRPLLLGHYDAINTGQLYWDQRNPDDDAANQELLSQVLSIASLCSVINQPGFVVANPAGSRQQRRAAQRAGGYAPTAWHKVSWNIGEAVKAKLSRDEPVRCMPLHYTRGHWRKAEEGWNNVERRKDGLWYQWIEGYWSGHPAFGIKRSYHAPKMAKAG